MHECGIIPHSCIIGPFPRTLRNASFVVIDNAIVHAASYQPNDRARADEPNVKRALDRTLSTEVTPCPARAAPTPHPPYLTSWAECLA